MGGLHTLTAATIAGAFVFGMVMALLGSIKLALAKRFQIDEARVGGLVSVLNLALIPATLLSGYLLDHWGVKPVMLLGSVLTALAFLGFLVGSSYRGALICIALLGLGGACVMTSTVVLMTQAFFGPEPQFWTASLNMGYVFCGLGGLVTATLADLLLRTVRYRTTMVVLAVMALVPAVIVLLPSVDAFPSLKTDSGDLVNDINAKLSTSPALWLAGLLFFLYAPVEFAIATWATTYLTDLGYRESRAAWLLSGFWLTFLASRLGTAFLQHNGVLPPWSDAALILLCSVGAAVALGNLAGASSQGNAGLGLLLLGAALGPILPTLVGVVFSIFPVEKHGMAFGAVFAIGSTGTLILAPIIGAYARRRTVQLALKIPMILCLAITAVALLMGLMNFTNPS
jgi:fucose permease